MSRKIVLLVAVFILSFPFHVCWQAHAEEPEWKVYDSDRIATHYYLSKGIRSPEEAVKEVWVRIISKEPDNLLLKEIYGKACEGMDFSYLLEITCIVQMNCFNRKYRVLGGLFEREFLTGICEPPPPYESVKWINIASGSPIEKLSKIMCPK